VLAAAAAKKDTHPKFGHFFSVWPGDWFPVNHTDGTQRKFRLRKKYYQPEE
jgi:hypothetical protein